MRAIASYDVYIESEKEDSLVLMKFPSLESQLENPASQISMSCKAASMRFKLEVRLDPQSENFSKEQAAALANKSIPKTFANNIVDKNFYSSSRSSLKESQLFVCKVVNERLVCRQVSDLLTMRSDLTHFDVKEESDSKEEVKPISVKFAASDRQTTSSTSKARDSNDEVDDSLDEFVKLRFKSKTSKETNLLRTSLFGQQLPKVKPDPDAEPKDIKPIVFAYDVKPKIDGILEQSSNSALIKQKVKECLLKAKIASLDEVMSFTKLESDSKDVIDALCEFGVLVQGNWAVKSEVLYENCADPTFNMIIAARDYLLWLFTQSKFVSRYEYSNRVRIPDNEILGLFKQLANFKSDTRRWELKLPSDDKFLSKHADIAQRQVALWKVKKANKLYIFGA